MALAASSLAVSGFFAKLAMASVSIYLAVTSRFVVPLVLTTLLFWRTGQLREVNREGLRSSIARALALCLAQYYLYETMMTTSLAEATILYNTGPLFITLWSVLTFRRLSPTRAAALTLGFGGVCVMSGLHAMQVSRAVITGVASGFFQSVSQILLHRATKKMGTTFVMFYVYLVGSIAWLTFLLARQIPLRLESGAVYSHLLMLWLLLSALGSMGNQQLRGEAYRRVEDPAVLSPLIYLTVPISALLDALVFSKWLPANKILGGVLITVGALLTMRDKDQPKKPSRSAS